MITIKEIAKLAGVSAKTAERALSGVTKDKRRDARIRAERVRQIAREHGYQPNEAALILRRGRSGIIGMVVDVLTDQFLAAAVETAITEAARAGYRISLQIVRFDPEKTYEAFKNLLAAGAEGIITTCASEHLPETLMNSLAGKNFPVFTLCGKSRYGFSSAAPDYSAALPEALKELKRFNHRQVTFCLFKGKDIDNKRAETTFRESCRQLGIEADFRIHYDRMQAEKLADEKLPAVILYGKYSMRIFLDRCAALRWEPDVIGIYNEWTLAAAQNFALRGIILENARESVALAVKQIVEEVDGGGKVCDHKLLARFVPETEFHALQVANLANQFLPETE